MRRTQITVIFFLGYVYIYIAEFYKNTYSLQKRYFAKEKIKYTNKETYTQAEKRQTNAQTESRTNTKIESKSVMFIVILLIYKTKKPKNQKNGYNLNE